MSFHAQQNRILKLIQMTFLLNKNIILKRINGKYQLPVFFEWLIDLPDEISSEYVFCRIVEFNEEKKHAYLKYDRTKCNENDFAYSKNDMANIIEESGLKTLEIIAQKQHTQVKKIYQKPPLNFDLEPISFSMNLSLKQPDNSHINQELPEQKIIEEIAEIPFENVYFEDRQITFNHFIKKLNKPIWFIVRYEFSKKYLDAIKLYFQKILKLPKLKFDIKITIKDDQIEDKQASSSDLYKINDNLLEKVECEYIRTQVFDYESGITDVKEKVKQVSEVLKNDNLNENNFLDYLLKIEKTKHYSHLTYLSKHHQPEYLNLKITSKPVSFIFLLRFEHCFYLIWETYSTEEATYIWKLQHTNKALVSEEVEKIIHQIQQMRSDGKSQFLKNDLSNFCRIYHNYKSADFGFNEWTEKIEQFCV